MDPFVDTNALTLSEESLSGTRHNATARVFTPRMVMYSSLGSLRSTDYINNRAPGDSRSLPTAAMPYAGGPGLTT